MLSFKEIRELIDLVSERGLAALEIEQAGFRVRIEGVRAASNGAGEPAAAVGGYTATPLAGGASNASLPAAATAPAAPAAPAEDKTLHVITSPIVGTFYRSPSPESDSFAEVGQRVARGKILCIIESMKLMNEIESDVEGEIVEVYPRNGQPVEYGEKLFAIRLAA
jgi:acetyl-CoA carboxylase biotin carboxyl carrier protein